jgi:AraC-like DNA-binding protein
MNVKDHEFRMQPAYIKVFLQHAIAERLPVSAVLAGTGLDQNQLLHSEQSVSFGDTLRVMDNVQRLLGPGWHLALGPRLTTPAHGPLGFAVVTAPDFRTAVDVLLQFIGIRGPFLWVSAAQEDQRFAIRLFEAIDMASQRQALIELSLLSIQALLQRPLGRRLEGTRVALAYPAPPHRRQLEAALEAQVEFGARGHTLSFPSRWLDEPCVLHDEAMHRYLVNRCAEETRAMAGGMSAETTVRQALLASRGQMPGLAEIAAEQHLSPRTLIRRLKRGGTSYKTILEQVRRSLAVDYLLHSDMSVSSIAYRLGYRDPSNFGRAFRSWFGRSPGRYRQEVRRDGRGPAV